MRLLTNTRKGVKSLIEAVALEGIHKMEVVEAF